MTTAAEGTTAPTTPAAGTTAPAAPVADVIEPVIVAIAPTGDPAQDLAIRHFVKAGIKPDSEAMALARSGDFSLLKAQAKEKGVAAGDEYVAILESAFSREKASADAVRAKAQEIAVSVAGTPEDWAACKAFIAEHADEQELRDINTALKSGGVLARATAQYLVDGWRKATGSAAAPKAAALPNDRAGGGKPADEGPLSPRAYSEAVQELSKKIGAGRVQGSQEYARLQQRRRAFRG